MKRSVEPLAWRLFLLLGLLVSCGSGEDAAIPIAELPLYTAEEARTYDDSLAQEIFDSGAKPTFGEPFQKRVLHADVIVQVKLVAINAERSEASVRYEIVTDPTAEPLEGELAAGSFELTVGRGSPSQAMLKALDTQLVGTHMIVFAKRYQRDGKLVVHFRAEPETVGVRDAVKKVLAQRRKQPPPS